MTEHTNNISVGVQELIEKLRDQGVSSGRTEAEQLVADARTEAARIVADASKKAESLITKAKKEADFTIKSGEESLQLAGRNAVLELKGYLMDKFSARINEVVSREMQDQHILEKMIVEVAGRNNLKGEENLQVVLPAKVVGVDHLQANPEDLKEGTLAYFTARHSKELLTEGVTFTVDEKQKSGITFRVLDKNLEVELDEGAVSDMLLRHLQPRFRALLEGTIK